MSHISHASPDNELPATSLDCFRSLQFITENPKWMQNVLFLAVCQMLPFIGLLLIGGYQFEVAESLLHRTRPGSYIDFDFDRFKDYLMRGLWPFLVTFVCSTVLTFPIAILWMFGFLFVMAAGKSGAPPPAILIVGFAALFLAVMVISIAFNVVLVPLLLRAGYSQDFGQAFNFQFAKNFLTLMWKETLLANVFLAVIALPLFFVGALLCLVGVYFTMSILMLAYAHLIDYQLYALYLSRGGEPIPTKAVAPVQA